MSSSFEHRRIVIAGGSGFLGVSLAHHLADRGASVVILSRKGASVTSTNVASLRKATTIGGSCVRVLSQVVVGWDQDPRLS